jgi:hypothetical protein
VADDNLLACWRCLGACRIDRSRTGHRTHAAPLPPPSKQPVCAPGYGSPFAPTATNTTSKPSSKPTCQKCAPGFVSGPEAPVLPATASSGLPSPQSAPARFNGPVLGRAGGMRQQGGKDEHSSAGQKQQKGRGDVGSDGGRMCVKCPAGTTANADQTKCM